MPCHIKVPTNVQKGNALGGRWKRAKDANRDGLDGGNLGDEYKALTGDAERERFRVRWAKKEHQRCVVSKQLVKSETHENWKRSEFMALGRIAKKEGGGRQGIVQVHGCGQHHSSLELRQPVEYLMANQSPGSHLGIFCWLSHPRDRVLLSDAGDALRVEVHVHDV